MDHRDEGDRIRVDLEEVNMAVDPENPDATGMDRTVLLEFYDAEKDLMVEVRADVIQVRDIVIDAYHAGLLDDTDSPMPEIRRKIELPPGLDPEMN